MEIKYSQEGEKQVVALIGKLDTNTAPMLEEASDKLFKDATPDIIIDMEQCTFVSSAGLRVIVAMQKRVMSGGSLVFHNVTPEVMDVFEMTGFTKILTFE